MRPHPIQPTFPVAAPPLFTPTQIVPFPGAPVRQSIAGYYTDAPGTRQSSRSI